MSNYLNKIPGLLALLSVARCAASVVMVHVGPVGADRYNPEAAFIQAGDTVQWIWDASFHSTSSGSPGAPNGLWDSGVHNAGFTFSEAFPSAGNFPYFCSVHGGCCGMLGAVKVFAAGSLFTVTNTSDSGPGSLRQAIADANAHVNVDANTPDTISFAIPTNDPNCNPKTHVCSIVPSKPFDIITDPVVIDGYTQSGSSPNSLEIGDNSAHLIEVSGNGAAFKALVIAAGNSTVRGLVINRFNGNGATTAITLQTGGNNKVEGCFLGLDATGAAAATNRDFGVDIESSPNNTIGGPSPAARNVISGNNTGVQINNSVSSGTIIQGNYIGTNAAGTAALTSGGVSQSSLGIAIGNNGAGTGSSNNTIGGATAAARNVVAGNASVNIELFDSSVTGNKIQGNYIGLNAAGTAAIVPNGDGVSLLRTYNTVIGGTGAAEGNVISGNSTGINIANVSGLTGLGNLIQGNLIGTDSAGNAAVPNLFGIQITSGQNNTVGGTATGARNVISGNSNAGLIIGSGFSFPLETANVVQGNFIGTNITGTAKVPNGGNGISTGGIMPAGTNMIGGLIAGAGNLISGNSGDGIAIGNSSNVFVHGNLIGTDVNGTGNLGNAGYGVTLSNADNNSIGGTAAGAANIIAFNGSPSKGSGGVEVLFGSGNSILGNSIFSNTGGSPGNQGLGINLFANGDSAGVTPNDPCDADSGSNNLQNYPVLKSVTNTGGSVNIIGTLNSVANTTYRVEYFRNDTVNPTGYGEGKFFLGFANVTTDASCNATFNVTFPTGAKALNVTATATDPSGNTSEFSAAIGQLAEISTRAHVLAGNKVMIGGFVLNGLDAKRVVVRSIGPTLAGFGINNPLADPVLQLFDGNNKLITSNDNWKTNDETQQSQQAEIEATGLAPNSESESVILRTLPANGQRYTAIVSGKAGGDGMMSTGTALIEVYDVDQTANSILANISTRGFVGLDNDVMIGGFITANGSTRVIVRALGPSLAPFLADTLADPTLVVKDAQGTPVGSNDNWRGPQESEIIASGLAPSQEAESAVILTLTPGRYTATVSGVSGGTGVALVEIYNIP